MKPLFFLVSLSYGFAQAQQPCSQFLSDLNALREGNNALVTWEISPQITSGKFKIYRAGLQPKSNPVFVRELEVKRDKQAYDLVDASEALRHTPQVEYSIELIDNQGNTICKTISSPRAGDGSDYTPAKPKNMAGFTQNLKYSMAMRGKTAKTVWIQPRLLDANHIPTDDDTYYVRFGEQLYEIMATPETDGLQKIKIPRQNNIEKVRQYQIVLIQGDFIVGISERLTIE